MGLRGPPKTPTKILKARGSWRAGLRDGEPSARARKLNPPAWLSARAKDVWRRLEPKLRAMGVLDAADENALARYCQLFARYRECETEIQEYGSFVNDDSGNEVELPAVKRAERLSQQLTRLEDRFGLSPSARASLAAERTDEEDEKERFFKITGFEETGKKSKKKSS